MPDLTVVIPTHNPDLDRFRATLAALRAQTLDCACWQVVVVNNASPAFPTAAEIADVCPPNLLVVPEPELGLTAARRRGLHETTTPIVVFADDDNALASDYLEQVTAIFAKHSRMGLAGGKSLPTFATPPPPWAEEFYSLLALRDLGDTPLIASGLRADGASYNRYPAFAPIGAGLAARRAALMRWLERPAALGDRCGTELTSGGDNDIVFAALQEGWEVGYFPSLLLSHMIPASRLDPVYLARLNRGIQRDWVQVLARYNANPWSPVSRWSVPLRQARAWFVHQAWSSPARRIRWQGACGRFDGLASLRS